MLPFDVNESVLFLWITGRQRLQYKYLAFYLWAHRDAIGDRMSQQLIHRSHGYRIRNQITVLRIPLQQTLRFQETANAVGDRLVISTFFI